MGVVEWEWSQSTNGRNNMTKEEAVTAIKIIIELGRVIKECGGEGAPEGPMYAAWMSLGGNLDSFQQALRSLERAGVIERRGFVCYWIGG